MLVTPLEPTTHRATSIQSYTDETDYSQQTTGYNSLVTGIVHKHSHLQPPMVVTMAWQKVTCILLVGSEPTRPDQCRCACFTREGPLNSATLTAIIPQVAELNC